MFQIPKLTRQHNFPNLDCLIQYFKQLTLKIFRAAISTYTLLQVKCIFKFFGLTAFFFQFMMRVFVVIFCPFLYFWMVFPRELRFPSFSLDIWLTKWTQLQLTFGWFSTENFGFHQDSILKHRNKTYFLKLR